MINEVCEKLTSYIDGSRYHNVFEYQKEGFIKIISYMKEHLNCVMDGGKKNVTDKELENIMNTTTLMIQAIALRELNEEDRNFIKNYMLLCYNFGQAYKSNNLVKQCEAISAITEYQNSMLAQIKVCQVMLKHMEKYEKFSPQAVKASESYLANIQERLKK